ncbi:MAG: Crp/Fnr family transcriptional regulator [Phyllobacteriaceae bacterium]|jgi:CRP-like cAMP-binding protein|nr:Crp/Fnr family transcriptional regulator [Phyllobacteriaceae bacterium]
MADNFERSPFEVLPQNLQAEISGALNRTVFAKGERLFQRGERNKIGLFWLRRGVTIFTQDELQGDFGFAWPFYWGIWGAPSLIGQQHAASWTTVTRCEMDVLPLEAVEKLSKNEAFSGLLSVWAARDLAISIHVSAVLNEQRTELKVQQYLHAVAKHALADPARRPSTGVTSIAWPFSKTDLARFLGVSRPHLSTVLGHLPPTCAVRIDGRYLSVDPVLLAQD